jgi:hypothetical protein
MPFRHPSEQGGRGGTEHGPGDALRTNSSTGVVGWRAIPFVGCTPAKLSDSCSAPDAHRMTDAGHSESYDSTAGRPLSTNPWCCVDFQ